MALSVLCVFILVYLGMILGNLPGLALDRTGIALLGAIAIIILQNLSLKDAVMDIDASSLAILFSFMIISAQFYFSGFYTYVSQRMERWEISPSYFLLAIICISGILSAVLINDIVCLAMAPLLIQICSKKKLDPVPFLIGLACGSNIGSALTLIGNPQNMLIGQLLNIPFAQYMLKASVPCLVGTFITWQIISWQTQGRWYKDNHEIEVKSPLVDPWQCGKGIIVLILLLTAFLTLDVPRDHASLIAAGFLLLSRQMASRTMLSFIDWQLLVLFVGLFIVNQEFNQSKILQSLVGTLKDQDINLYAPAPLFILSALLSNLISNVPAVMLLAPFATDDFTGSLLAISSTLAGNMFILGSIANIIVINQAANFGINITWKTHLAVDLPVSLTTLGVAGLWLYFLPR
jgi:Na+/H+ antiporter NhaD/arsenite permease-like protein